MSSNQRKPSDPLLEQVLAAIHLKKETPPEGFRTLQQWADHWKVARSSASTYIRKAMELGLMEKRRFIVSAYADARAYPTDHYRDLTRNKRG